MLASQEVMHCAAAGAGLVKSRPLDRWRETLALLSAYSDTGEFCALADMLAKRLAGAGLPQVRAHAACSMPSEPLPNVHVDAKYPC
jgi:hypothetical protein